MLVMWVHLIAGAAFDRKLCDRSLVTAPESPWCNELAMAARPTHEMRVYVDALDHMSARLPVPWAQAQVCSI